MEKEKTQKTEEELYFVEVPIFIGKYHIFKEDRSLCNRWLLPSDVKQEDKVRITFTETLGRDDCKTCFKKLEKIKEVRNSSQA